MTDIYNLWKNNKVKNNIKSLLKIIYTIDIINSISRIRDCENWCTPSYTNNETKMWCMKNPLLNNEQTGNPSNLSKSIIITGPNAAGKTTYVKSILSNVILAHTFGIVNSIKAEIILYDVIYSFMRITDILGEKSYFEIETEYCSSMINKALIITSENKKGLFLMDEPMHSTPPTEGMATAYAVAEYIGNLQGINLLITTHFHKLILLEKYYPNKCH
jgi:DNA mismatch repair ATPase MutS